MSVLHSYFSLMAVTKYIINVLVKNERAIKFYLFGFCSYNISLTIVRRDMHCASDLI